MHLLTCAVLSFLVFAWRICTAEQSTWIESVRTTGVKSEFYTVTDCVTYGDFKLWFGGTLMECAEECLRRQRCVGINYHRFTTMCSLKEANPPNVTVTHSSHSYRCVYAARDLLLTWAPYDLGVCNSNNPPCGATERCESSSDSSSHLCRLTECKAMPAIEFASITSSLCDIGVTNAYLCDTGYTSLGEGSITTTCMRNATWSDVNKKCYKNCVEPSGINFRSTTRLTFGTVVNLSCPVNSYSPDRRRHICNITGQWNEVDDPDTCIKNCFLSDVKGKTNADDKNLDESYPYDTTIFLKCDLGFISDLDGTDKIYRTCSQSQTWVSDDGHCKKECVQGQAESLSDAIVAKPSEDHPWYTLGDKANASLSSCDFVVMCISGPKMWASFEDPDGCLPCNHD